MNIKDIMLCKSNAGIILGIIGFVAGTIFGLFAHIGLGYSFLFGLFISILIQFTSCCVKQFVDSKVDCTVQLDSNSAFWLRVIEPSVGVYHCSFISYIELVKEEGMLIRVEPVFSIRGYISANKLLLERREWGVTIREITGKKTGVVNISVYNSELEDISDVTFVAIGFIQWEKPII